MDSKLDEGLDDITRISDLNRRRKKLKSTLNLFDDCVSFFDMTKIPSNDGYITDTLRLLDDSDINELDKYLKRKLRARLKATTEEVSGFVEGFLETT